VTYSDGKENVQFPSNELEHEISCFFFINVNIFRLFIEKSNFIRKMNNLYLIFYIYIGIDDSVQVHRIIIKEQFRYFC